MTKQVPFHELLRSERERAGLSLRRLAERAGQNPGSLSRMEAGELTPRLATLLAIAKAIAESEHTPPSRKDQVIVALLDAAGRLPADIRTVSDVRARFEQRVREEGADEHNVAIAMEQVDLPTMVRVVTGLERLRVRRPSEIGSLEAELEPNEQVVVLADRAREFNVGSRASLVVKGDLTETQTRQLKLLVQLLATCLEPPPAERRDSSASMDQD